MRAPQPGPQQPKQPQPIISRAAVRAASRTRAFQQRTARLIHAVSVPTPTPLVRKRVVQTPNGNDRAQVVARAFRRRRAHILIRSNPTATAPTQTPRAPLVTHRARAARVRAAARTHVRILRSIVAPQRPVKVITAAPAARRAARVRFTQRHRARIIAPHVTAPVVVRQQQPRVTRQRASQRIRYTRARQPVILRGPLVVTGRRTVRTLVIVRNRRAANVRAYFLRHRAHYETSTLGSAAPPVVIYTGFYDHPSPADGFDGPSLAANGYDQPSPTSGYDEPSLATAGFDQPSPTSGGYDH